VARREVRLNEVDVMRLSATTATRLRRRSDAEVLNSTRLWPVPARPLAALAMSGEAVAEVQTVQFVAEPAITGASIATATGNIVPAERTVDWYLPVVIIVVLLIIAAGLGLLIAHIVKGGM